jgi:predicted transposase YbfD/YdcC
MRPAWCWRKRGVRSSKHEAELTVAPALLGQVALEGRVVTGDALYCQRKLCQQILAAGGDYLVVVKANQPDLYEDLAVLFAVPPPGEAFATAVQYDKGHGRREVRRLWASTALAGYLNWPGAQQACKLERTVAQRGKRTQEVRYLLTSRGPQAASAAALLRLRRGHWGIENRLHWVRDLTLGEDASQVRTGAAPEVLAALRNTVLAVLRQTGSINIAASLREIGWRNCRALQLLGWAPR